MSTTLTPTTDFSKLPAFERRKFLPQDADLTNTETIVSLLQRLIQAPINSKEDLEAWLQNRSELEAAFDQAGSVLYIQMTCQTDDPAKAKAYTDFIENVLPAVKPLSHRIDEKYLKAQKKFKLDKTYLSIFDKISQADVSLFIDKNIPLQTQVALLAQEYQSICGAMTVTFEGKELTLPRMSKFLLEPDRQLREKAWRAIAARRLQEQEKLNILFDKMLKLRVEIAKNAGCKDFAEYQFKAYHRFDYTLTQCHQYHKAMKECVVPLWKKILERRRRDLKVETLKPWDMAVDPFNRPPLKPFDESQELIAKTKEIFNRLDKELGKQFTDMAGLGLLDLESRKGKAPGGYQTVLAEAKKPFIFMNAVGLDQDVRTLLHEAGHAFHAIAGSRQKFFTYRHAQMEFCEVASMGMELLAEDHLNVFYSPEDHARSKIHHLEDIVYTLAWVATVDSFQEWIYKNPTHTQEERSKAWQKCYDSFGGKFVDWTGLEQEKTNLWHRQLHVFEVPFYYIEYGIAQIGALQLWLSAKKNLKKTLQNYKSALKWGGSVPVPVLYKTAGLKFDFSSKTVSPLIKVLEKELQLKS